MAQTLNSLFPFSLLRSEKVDICPAVVVFEAPIIAGEYVFSEATTPAKPFGDLPQGQAGVIAGVMISANCTPEDFAAAAQNINLQVLHGGNNTPINMKAFPFSTFQDGENFQASWKITASNSDAYDTFKIAVRGKVSQIANMSENVLRLKVAFNFLRMPEAMLG